MPVYAGIDEAGYGPLLGPLCVAGAAFQLPCSGDPPNLWNTLQDAICRKPGDRRRRIAIDDSKRLKGPNDGKSHPLRHLERGVLAFASLHQCPPDCDDSLFTHLGVSLRADHPWQRGPQSIPLDHQADEIRIAAAGLRRSLEKARVQPLAIQCEAVDPADFNRFLACQNKADINFDAAMRRVNRILASAADQPAVIVIDRHGGRIHYREPLQMYFPDAYIRIAHEGETHSEYHVDRPSAPPLTIRFQVEADADHLPVALASMTAKYVRELVMYRLNRFFRSHLPELKPTAGYATDGRRFLSEVQPLMARLGITPELLVRRS